MSDWFSGRRGGGGMGPAFDNLQSELSRVLNDFGFAPAGTPGAVMTQPKVDVIATERGGLEVQAELPGVEERDIDLSVDGNLLVLRGERRADREENRRAYRVRERTYGAFSRSIALPFEPQPDQIDAEFRNGVLTVRVERPQPNQQRGAKVQIRTGGSAGAGSGGGGSGGGQTGSSGGGTSGQTGGSTGGQTGPSGMMNEGGTADTSRSGGMLNEGI
jgi:HSP20 family protein